VLGLGEAGSIYARGLAERGAEVVGFDPVVLEPPAGVERRGSVAEAAAGADVVLSLVGAKASAAVLDEALPAMIATAVFADFNTGSPAHKRDLATRAAAAGIPFADVAVMAPVPRAGIRTELFASGDGATPAVDALAGHGVPIRVVGTAAGDAAGLKLVRSVFMKGLAGLVFESLDAAEKIGATAEVRAQLAAELGPNGDALVQRLLDGTVQHAARREHEMLDARAFLESLGTPPRMTDGTIAWLHALASAGS
jgi:3-hydroxyisobutyrate dehydrogenase and related beta-hydroxyacid dehydrogenases